MRHIVSNREKILTVQHPLFVDKKFFFGGWHGP
jgi:hypothetical protein